MFRPQVVGVTGRTDLGRAVRVAERVCRLCDREGLDVLVDDSLGTSGYPRVDLKDMGGEVDVIVTVGGDGTILRVSRITSEHEVPILGVNLGKFGFLTEVSESNLKKAVSRLARGDFNLEEHRKLRIRIGGSDEGDALNEVTVITSRPAKMIRYRLSIDGFELETTWADGVLVATPTGSTAYSLSAGGPIVEPQVECSIITPLNPFKLEARPMVVSMDRRVEIDVDDPERAEVVVDGQEYMNLDGTVSVTRSPNVARFVRFGSTYFERLKEKFLRWD
ncbi:NAD(+)/NADH kinase [Methanopyrus sp.]